MSDLELVKFTDIGLTVESNDIEFEEAESIYNTLDRQARSSPWWIGDLLLWMEARFGEEYAQVLDPDAENYSQQIQAMRVARSFPQSVRVPQLSWTHHREALSSDAPNVVLEWAAENGASTRELIAHIKASKPPKERPHIDWTPPETIYVRADKKWSHEMPEGEHIPFRMYQLLPRDEEESAA